MSEFKNIELKQEAKKEYEELPLQLQIMHELKLSSQRWFIIAMAELVVILLFIIFVFLIPVETTSEYSQEVTDVYDTNTVSQSIGD